MDGLNQGALKVTKMLNKKSVRITVGIIFLFLLVLSIVPNLYIYSSGDGVVNALTTVLRSPIEGVLHFSAPMNKEFQKGDTIGKVLNDRVNHSFLYELMTEKKMLDSRIESFTERLDRYKKLSVSLGENLSKYQIYSAKQLDMQVKQDEHKLTEERAEFERAKKEFEASKILSFKDAINKRELERTESNKLKSEERIMNLEFRVEEQKNSLEAVSSGVFLGNGRSDDSPYSKQRMDQMVIEISLAQTTLDEAKSRVEGINKQIETEKARIEKAECFEIISPFDALIWRQPLTESSTVVINSELIVILDCSSVFLDIAVSESQFSNIGAGDKIQYRLIGDTGYKIGEVMALRGSGTQLGDQNLAATLNKDPRKEFRVWVKAKPSDLGLCPDNFYQVGRRLEVKIPRKWHLLKEIGRFIDVF